MSTCCHLGSSIDAAGACGNDRRCIQIAIAPCGNYISGRHIASAIRNSADQAPVLKRPAAQMCSQPCASSGVGANNGSVEDARGLASGGNALRTAVAELSTLKHGQLLKRSTSLGVAQRDESKRQKRRHQLEEDCRLALEVQQPEMQQEAPQSATNLDAPGLAGGGNALRAAVARLSALSRSQLEARAISVGVVHRDSKTRKTRRQLEEDCRLALEALQSEMQQEGRRCGYALGAPVAKSPALSLNQLRARATSLGVAHRDESKKQKTSAQLKEDCRIALQACRPRCQHTTAPSAPCFHSLRCCRGAPLDMVAIHTHH